MRESSPRGWHRWRVTVRPTPPTAAAAASAAFDHMTRLGLPRPAADPGAPAASEERPGPDGIRHELVARIRQQIADGTYDTEEKWLRAEEALLRRVCG
jgi:hypothetical protein